MLALNIRAFISDGSIFLGDAAYPCHGFGVLKQRFRQLYFLKLRNMQFIVKFILACCVLHNLADLNDLEHIEQPEDEDNADINAQALLHHVPATDEDQDPIDDRHGRDFRDELCRQLFQRPFDE